MNLNCALFLVSSVFIVDLHHVQRSLLMNPMLRVDIHQIEACKPWACFFLTFLNWHLHHLATLRNLDWIAPLLGAPLTHFPFERCLTPSFFARGIMWAFKLKSCKQLLWNAVTTAIFALFGLMSATEDEGSSELVWESEISSVSESANTQHLFQYWWHIL